MTRSHDAPGRRILRLWRKLRGWPGGTRAFSLLIGFVVPYSGTLRPRVRRLDPGRCRVEMSERRRVRNHLASVHAAALVNLGELATGLATLTALPPGVRGIVTGLEAEYGKKGRGRLEATCRTELPEPERLEPSAPHRAQCRIHDREGDHVATVRATWKLSSLSQA